MIAASSTGTSFGALGAYLVGYDGRVGWAESWNTMEQDPRAAAGAMRRHVDLSESRVKRPVYHVAISFDPDDRPSEAEVREAARRTLQDLGLDKHQALVVRHTDQPHAHVHLMINRVGPDGRAWSTSHERRRLRASMERQERELGVRWTGRNADLARPDRDAPAGAARARDCGFAAHVRTQSLGDIQTATSWGDLDARLASRGLRIERRGRGAIVTDGKRETKLSSVSRTVSRSKLEARFGPLRDDERGQTAGSRPPVTPSVARQPSPHGPAGSFAESRRTTLRALRQSSWKTIRGARRAARYIDLDGEEGGDERIARGAARSVRARSARVALGIVRSGAGPSLAQRSLADRAVHRDVRPGGRIDRLVALVGERTRLTRLETQWGAVLGLQTRGREQAAAEVQALRIQVERAGERFTGALFSVYASPQAAAHAFVRGAARDGLGATAKRMAASPEAFGRIRPPESRPSGLRGGLARLLTPATQPDPSLVSEAARAGTAYVRANASYLEATTHTRTGAVNLREDARRVGLNAAGRREARIRPSLFADKQGRPQKTSVRLDAQIGRAFDRIGQAPGQRPKSGREAASLVEGASRKAAKHARLATRVSRSVSVRLGTVGLGVAATAARSVVRGLGR